MSETDPFSRLHECEFFLIFIRLECEMTECLSVVFSGEHLPNKNSADSMPSFNKTICTFW